MLNKKVRFSACLVAFLVSDAHALTIGDIGTASHLGEPFKASVPLSADGNEKIDSSCIFLDQGASPDGVFKLKKAAIGFENGKIQISTQTRMDEPIVSLQINIQCNGKISKAFTVFLDPPKNQPIIEKPVIAEKAEAPAEKAAAAPRPVSQEKPKPGLGAPWKVKANETLSGIAHDFYPYNTLMQKKLVQAILRENPKISRDHLVSGTTIRIPEISPGQSVATIPKPVAKAPQKPLVAPKAEVTPQPKAKFSVSILPGEKAGEKTAAESAQAKSDEQSAELHELKEQIRKLEEKLADLQNKINLADRQIALLKAAPAPEKPMLQPMYLWAAGGLLLVAAAGYLIRKRKSAAADERIDEFVFPAREETAAPVQVRRPAANTGIPPDDVPSSILENQPEPSIPPQAQSLEDNPLDFLAQEKPVQAVEPEPADARPSAEETPKAAPVDFLMEEMETAEVPPMETEDIAAQLDSPEKTAPAAEKAEAPAEELLFSMEELNSPAPAEKEAGELIFSMEEYPPSVEVAGTEPVTDSNEILFSLDELNPPEVQDTPKQDEPDSVQTEEPSPKLDLPPLEFEFTTIDPPGKADKT